MKLNLGTFEYGAKARWSVVVAVCCFLALLMLPAIAEATILERVSGRTTRTSARSGNWGNDRVHARGDNRCRINPMRIAIQRIRTNTNTVDGQATLALQPGRSGTTIVLHPNASARMWRVQIQPVSGLEFFGCVRAQR